MQAYFAPFKNDATKWQNLKDKFVKYFRYLLDGDKEYSGMGMKEAHKDLKITDELFDLF